MKKTLLLLAVFAAFAAQCAAPKADAAVPADAEDPFFEPPVIDLEGSPAEGLFNYNFCIAVPVEQHIWTRSVNRHNSIADRRNCI